MPIVVAEIEAPSSILSFICPKQVAAPGDSGPYRHRPANNSIYDFSQVLWNSGTVAAQVTIGSMTESFW